MSLLFCLPLLVYYGRYFREEWQSALIIHKMVRELWVVLSVSRVSMHMVRVSSFQLSGTRGTHGFLKE